MFLITITILSCIVFFLSLRADELNSLMNKKEKMLRARHKIKQLLCESSSYRCL